MILYSKLPEYAKLSLVDFDDFTDELTRDVEKALSDDNIEAKIWENFSEKLQREILAEIKMNLENQLEIIENL